MLEDFEALPALADTGFDATFPALLSLATVLLLFLGEAIRKLLVTAFAPHHFVLKPGLSQRGQTMTIGANSHARFPSDRKPTLLRPELAAARHARSRKTTPATQTPKNGRRKLPGRAV
ncbi:MAG: hypothetical protein FJX29_02070 [Alphaproteobacteria bacterium]|nr:hypothetical protein [Alphaproteobacteria bacterium]